MELQTNYIVFQCYGNESIFHECGYALLSLSRLYAPGELKDTEIWIYTDKPEWFKSFKDCWLPLNFRTVDDNTIKLWKGDINFVHRVKIEVLKDLLKDKAGNILYLDCDIVITHPIDQMLKNINSGRLYMHMKEGLISDRGNKIFEKLHDHYKNKPTTKVNDKPVHEFAMWNAGVLGFNTKYAHLLDEVLTFTDTQYPTFPKHVIEQFAFAIYFQKAGPVKAAAPYIFHYWNLKEARTVLASFFAHFKDGTWEELTRYSSLIQIHALMQDKVNFYRNRGILGSLQGKKWQPGNTDWEELVKQL
jgi:hypothetical protein